MRDVRDSAKTARNAGPLPSRLSVGSFVFLESVPFSLLWHHKKFAWVGGHRRETVRLIVQPRLSVSRGARDDYSPAFGHVFSCLQLGLLSNGTRRQKTPVSPP